MSDYLKGKRVVDPVLTSIARGYKNAAFIGERIFPVVLTDKEGVRVPTFGKTAFVEYDTERGPVRRSSSPAPRRRAMNGRRWPAVCGFPPQQTPPACRHRRRHPAGQPPRRRRGEPDDPLRPVFLQRPHCPYAVDPV